MKELIALLFGVCITVIVIFLHVRGKISKGSASVFFAFAVLGGLAIANHDIVTKFEWAGVSK